MCLIIQHVSYYTCSPGHDWFACQTHVEIHLTLYHSSVFCFQFHHRDPGIVGLLTSYDIPKPMFYGLIADGIHTHPTATRIAHRSHPKGM